MTILITGATGMIGQQIVKVCRKHNHIVHYLTRSQKKIEKTDNYKGFHWDIDKGEIDLSCFKGVEAIINLAGSTIAKRWTQDYKEIILNSRLNSLELIRSSLEKIEHNVKHITSASAIGIYPNSLTKYYGESSKVKSTTFLGKVVEQWEEKIDRFKDLDIKTCIIRIGLVLSDKDGALPQMVKPTKLGMGAAFGTGKQWQSWIHVSDLAQIFVFTIENSMIGIFNGVAPNPVTNKEFTECVAHVLGKPLILPNVPKFVMKMALGEMHILLFESQRVSSSKIEKAGYDYSYANLQPALNNLL